MPKDYPVKENIYLILLKYFNGDVVYLTDEKVKDLKKNEVLDYINKGIEDKSYFIFAICLADNGLHIGNVKIGPIKSKYCITDLVTVIGYRNYWGKPRMKRKVYTRVSKKARKLLGWKKGGKKTRKKYNRKL